MSGVCEVFASAPYAQARVDANSANTADGHPVVEASGFRRGGRGCQQGTETGRTAPGRAVLLAQLGGRDGPATEPR